MIPLGILAQVGQLYTTWTRATAPATVPYHSITYAPLTAGNWFMFGLGSGGATTANYYYSTDGSSWTTGTMPSTSSWGLSATNGTTLVAYQARAGATSVQTTTNGTTWTSRSLGTGSYDSACLKFIDGRFWLGATSGQARYSSDGTTWTSLSLTFDDIDFGNGTYITVVNGGTHRICTGDPTVIGNWTTLTLPTISLVSPMTVAFANGVWVVGYGSSSNTTTSYAYSTNNGSSWNTGTLPASLGTFATGSGASFNGAANTRMRAVDGAFYYSINNSVFYSTDGINWTTISTGTGLTFNSKGIASNGAGQAIMAGHGGTNASNTSTYLRGA